MYGGSQSISLAEREQPVAHPQRGDEPLARRHDLERPLALLVELDGVPDRPRLAERARRRREQLDDRGLRLLDGLAGELGVGLVGRGGVVGLEAGLAERRRQEPPVAADERTKRERRARATR